MYYTYILKSEKNDSYYIGSCEDLVRRLKQHNEGSVISTKRYMPWKIVCAEEYVELREASKREKQIKSWKKREAIERLLKNRKIL